MNTLYKKMYSAYKNVIGTRQPVAPPNKREFLSNQYDVYHELSFFPSLTKRTIHKHSKNIIVKMKWARDVYNYTLYSIASMCNSLGFPPAQVKHPFTPQRFSKGRSSKQLPAPKP